MKTFSNTTFFLFILLFLAIPNAVIAKDHKLMMVYIEMQHCPWCQKMDKEIFDNPEYMKKLEKMYIVNRILRESNNIPSYLKPRYYPTTYVLAADGIEILDELPGYMERDRFMDYVTDLHAIETSQSDSSAE